MITSINEFKNTLNENNDSFNFNKTRETSMTIEELLKWYTGESFDNSAEFNEIIITNFFKFENNELIEFTENDINNLINNKNELVVINSDDIGNVIDNEFILNNITITFDSIDYPGEEFNQ